MISAREARQKKRAKEFELIQHVAALKLENENLRKIIEGFQNRASASFPQTLFYEPLHPNNIHLLENSTTLSSSSDLSTGTNTVFSNSSCCCTSHDNTKRDSEISPKRICMNCTNLTALLFGDGFCEDQTTAAMVFLSPLDFSFDDEDDDDEIDYYDDDRCMKQPPLVEAASSSSSSLYSSSSSAVVVVEEEETFSSFSSSR